MEPKQKIILIADDDAEDQELLEEALLDIDPHVRADKVWDGREVLAYLENCTPLNMPCAILLDYSMPFMTGAEVLSVICKDSRFEEIPKFVWSTSSSKIHINECIGNGAMHYFIKPSSPDKLNELVKTIVDSFNS